MGSFCLTLNTFFFFQSKVTQIGFKKEKNAINLGFTVIYIACAIVFLFGLSGSLGRISLLSTGNTHLGISTSGNFTDVNDGNYKSASVFTSEESGTVTSITALIARVNTPGNVMAAIYVADSEGNPGVLLGTSTETSVSTSMGWVNFSLLSSVPVAVGGQYALAVCSDDFLRINETSGSGVRIHNFNDFGSFSNQFENDRGIQSDTRGAMSIYANITEETATTINPNATFIPSSQMENTSLVMAVLGGAGAGLSALALVLANFRKVKMS